MFNFVGYAPVTAENAALVYAMMNMQQQCHNCVVRASDIAFEMLVFGYRMGPDYDEAQMEAIDSLHEEYCHALTSMAQLNAEIQKTVARLCADQITE